jgi:hypothetical protein
LKHHTDRTENSLPLELHKLIHSDKFKASHRRSNEDFTRNRTLPFSRTMLLLLGLPQKSYAAELRTCFKTLDGTDVNSPTKAAFSKARSKIKHSAFISLNDSLLSTSSGKINKYRKRFKGYIIIGIDGSYTQLPDEKILREYFDPNRVENDIPLARISECFDIGSDLRLDAIIAPTATSERIMLVDHLKKLPPNALIVLDRGYAAHWVFQLLIEMNIKFCIRTSVGFNQSVKDFLSSEEQDATITVPATSISNQQLEHNNLTPEPVDVRAVRIELNSGETEVLITNIDEDEMSPMELKEVYWMRWGSETAYKREKLNYCVENFTGKTVESIYQDYYANIVMMNLTAVIALPAHEIIEDETSTRKQRHSLNWMNAARLMRENGIALLGLAKKSGEILCSIFRNLGEDLNSVRPNRQFDRTKKTSRRKFNMNRKML